MLRWVFLRAFRSSSNSPWRSVMTLTESSPVVVYAKSLFTNPGLEEYDSATQELRNVGAAKPYFHLRWKNSDSGVGFNDTQFEQVIKKENGMLFSLNRVELNVKGEPLTTIRDDHGGFVTMKVARDWDGVLTQAERDVPIKRISHGLGFYCQYSASPAAAKGVIARVLAAKPEFDGYIATAEELLRYCGNIRSLTSFMVRDNISGANIPVKLHSFIVMALSPGGLGGGQVWYIKSRNSARVFNAQQTVAADEDIPL